MLWSLVRAIVYLILLGFSYYETGPATVILIGLLLLGTEAIGWYVVKELDELKESHDSTGSD